jgi:protein involved in polysaccharide export with SLBB domain
VAGCVSILMCTLLVAPRLLSQDEPAGSVEPSYEAADQYAKDALEGTVDPASYVLGPGDALSIGFWGEVNRVDGVVINPDGDALIAPVGPVHLDGLTLKEARELIRSRLSAYYRPSILSVSLASIRRFQAHVVGMVEKPGAFEVNGVTRVSQAVALAGGLQEGSSRRNILIRRDQGDVRVDLTRYLLLGENAMNPFLKDGDIVYVPPMSGPVHIFGSVYRPHMYEFIEGEILGELLELAGGFRPEAYTESIEVQRYEAEDPSVSRAVVLSGEPSVLSTFRLKMGDRIFVRSIPDWHEDAQVAITGEVKYPGVYVIDQGVERLSDVVTRAGGFTEDASLAEARLIRGAYEARAFPIEAEVSVLKQIENSFDHREKDLIKTMGRERKGSTSMSFEKVFLEGDSRYDPPLYDGDIIEVPRASWFVRVSGQVRTPGLVAFRAGETYDYYIAETGGFSRGADRRGTRLVTAMSGQTLKAGGEQVRPGDVIWVPKKKEREWWTTTREILQLLAQIATIYVVADQISSR